MSNQQFGVNDTTNDITHNGPVAQELALHKGATLFAITDGANVEALSFGTVKQAALGTTVVVDFSNLAGAGTQVYTLNKEAGAGNGTVAADLIAQLLLKRVGDCALLHFHACERLTSVSTISVQSDDTSVTGSPAILYAGALAPKVGGEAIIEVRATSVTSGAETVSLFSGENAFV
uniref:Uncharacterized protein n=1 Tax=Iridovirus LCIVAC01 TaxID=2506607 RepID=A0A481YR54_9VIRU|nr:MAG: hypothetical protein LCIVAC01_01960 [Iridovirus LCIVAC01]